MSAQIKPFHMWKTEMVCRDKSFLHDRVWYYEEYGRYCNKQRRLLNKTEIVQILPTVQIVREENNMSWNRSAKWIKFSEKMPSHLIHYCDVQYPTTDPDNDLDNWTIEEVKAHIKTYVGRIGSTQRGAEQAKEDMIKLAHFASIIWNKLEEKSCDQKK